MPFDQAKTHALRDEIMVIVAREFRENPVELLAAQLLSLKSLTETAKQIARPASLLLLDEAVDLVLFEMVNLT